MTAWIKSVLAAAMISTASAGELPPAANFDHNGSLMIYWSTGTSRVFAYQIPRPAIAALGVIPGTVLFAGEVDNAARSLTGRAFVFAPGCAPIPYPVQGVSADPTGITLEGPAPIVGEGCIVQGYTWDSPNARLFFRRVP